MFPLAVIVANRATTVAMFAEEYGVFELFPCVAAAVFLAVVKSFLVATANLLSCRAIFHSRHIQRNTKRVYDAGNMRVQCLCP